MASAPDGRQTNRATSLFVDPGACSAKGRTTKPDTARRRASLEPQPLSINRYSELRPVRAPKNRKLLRRRNRATFFVVELSGKRLRDLSIAGERKTRLLASVRSWSASREQKAKIENERPHWR